MKHSSLRIVMASLALALVAYGVAAERIDIKAYQLPNNLAAIQLTNIPEGVEPRTLGVIEEALLFNPDWREQVDIEIVPCVGFGCLPECPQCPTCLTCPPPGFEISPALWSSSFGLMGAEDFFADNLPDDLPWESVSSAGCTYTYSVRLWCRSFIPPDCTLTVTCTQVCSDSLSTVIAPMFLTEIPDVVFPWNENFSADPIYYDKDLGDLRWKGGLPLDVIGGF